MFTKPAKLTPEETAEKYKQTRREWYKRNAASVIEKNKAYREANKDKLKERWAIDNKKLSLKKKEEKETSLKELAEKYAPVRTKPTEQVYMTRKEIADDLGVKLTYIEGIAKNERYRMPKHVHTNGLIFLYCRKQINDWYPFAKEALAFHKINGRKKDQFVFRPHTMAHGLIMFMKNNKELHLRNLELRRLGEIYA